MACQRSRGQGRSRTTRLPQADHEQHRQSMVPTRVCSARLQHLDRGCDGVQRRLPGCTLGSRRRSVACAALLGLPGQLRLLRRRSTAEASPPKADGSEKGGSCHQCTADQWDMLLTRLQRSCLHSLIAYRWHGPVDRRQPVFVLWREQVAALHHEVERRCIRVGQLQPAAGSSMASNRRLTTTASMPDSCADEYRS